MGKTFSILIGDDHAVVRRGLRQIFDETEEFKVIAEAGDGFEVLEQVRKHPVDLVVLDISMPGLNGLDALKQLRNEFPALPVLVLSIYGEDQYAVRVLKAGASGYLSKESAPEELLVAARRIVHGGKYVSPSLAEKLAMEIQTPAAKMPHELLSDREYQVMCLIASGKTVSEIATELHLSVKTVSTYRSRLLIKMGMKNNAEITHYAIKNGLVK